jgi:uncharacterized damage-inducible protein DinB
MTENKLGSMLRAELEQETDRTRRVLERLPVEHLSWKPHAKSMSLGQLGLHVAGLPGAIADLVRDPVGEVPTVPLPEADSTEQMLDTLSESVARADDRLASWGDDYLMAEWRMTRDGETLLALPRVAMLRSIMLNHWYHHRGQLLVYLRLLDVPVPAVYGPSADENPFAPDGA